MFPFHFGITSSGSLAVRFCGRKVKTVFSGVLDPGIDKKEAKWIMITGMDFERISKSLQIISRVNSKALPSRRLTVRPWKSMVGRWNFLLYASLSSWCYVSFRQGNSNTKIKVHRARLLCHFAFKNENLWEAAPDILTGGTSHLSNCEKACNEKSRNNYEGRAFFHAEKNIEKSVFSKSKIRQFRSPSFRPRSFTNQNHSPGQDYHLRIWDEVMLCLPLRSRHVEFFKIPLPNMLPGHHWWPSATSATSFSSLGHALRYGSDWFSPWSFGPVFLRYSLLCWIWNIYLIYIYIIYIYTWKPNNPGKPSVTYKCKKGNATIKGISKQQKKEQIMSRIKARQFCFCSYYQCFKPYEWWSCGRREKQSWGASQREVSCYILL